MFFAHSSNSPRSVMVSFSAVGVSLWQTLLNPFVGFSLSLSVLLVAVVVLALSAPPFRSQLGRLSRTVRAFSTSLRFSWWCATSLLSVVPVCKRLSVPLCQIGRHKLEHAQCSQRSVVGVCLRHQTAKPPERVHGSVVLLKCCGTPRSLQISSTTANKLFRFP